MDYVDGPIPLGEWKPDAEDLKFPDLAEALQVEPNNIVYKSFAPLVNTGGPVVPGDFPHGLSIAVYSGIAYYYVATNAGIYESTSGLAFTARSATMLSAQFDFQQYENLEIVQPSAAVALYRTLGSASNFTTLGSSSGTAPAASRIGRIGQFIIVGNLATTNAIQWSGIDNPLSWPTPLSVTATAQQSGKQVLPSECGEVTGFSGGDQFGIVFQYSGITRMTYVQPPSVFQFDQISDKIGCEYPRSIIKVGGWTYFISTAGFFKTDGVNIINIGVNRINRFFDSASSGAKERVYSANNKFTNTIYWAYCNTFDADSTPSDLILYNYISDRFTRAHQFCDGIFSTHGIGGSREIAGLGTSGTFGSFASTTSSTPGTLETGDIEFNPGGRAFLSGAKLLVDQTANGVVAYSEIRDELVSNQLTASAATTTNSSTGFADFRRDARYHRMKWEVSGVFSKAQAMEFIAKPSGGR